jgi:hypothetical protein
MAKIKSTVLAIAGTLLTKLKSILSKSRFAIAPIAKPCLARHFVLSSLCQRKSFGF